MEGQGGQGQGGQGQGGQGGQQGQQGQAAGAQPQGAQPQAAAGPQDVQGMMNELQRQLQQLRIDVGNQEEPMDVSIRNVTRQLQRVSNSVLEQQERQTQGMAKTGMKLRDYQLGDDILDYVEHAMHVKVCNGWSDAMAKYAVKAALKGDAAKMVTDIVPNVTDAQGFHETLESFLKRLRDRFVPASEGEVAMLEFIYARQGPMELTQVFHARVRSLYLRAYHRDSLGQIGYEFSVSEENMLISTFKRGLRNPTIQDAVQRGKPKTYAEALEAALDEIAVIKMRRFQNRAPFPGSRGGGNPHGSYRNGGGGQVNSMQPRPTQGGNGNRTNAGGRRCYTCQSDQHMERQCPSRRKWFKAFNKSDTDYENWVKQKRANPPQGRIAAVQEGEDSQQENGFAEDNQMNDPDFGHDEGQEEPCDNDPDFQ